MQLFIRLIEWGEMGVHLEFNFNQMRWRDMLNCQYLIVA